MQRPIHTLIITAATLAGVVIYPATADEALNRGAILSASCASCHGPEGRSPGAIPAIAGKTAEDLRVMLEDFRSGKRRSTVMGRHAKGYSDEEIQLIATHLGKQK